MSRPSVPVWVELICTQCAKPGVGRFVRDGRNFRDNLVRNARAEGWVFKHREVFCCQEHADAYAERQKEKAIKAAA